MGVPVVWRSIPGWEGKYWVSNTGIVKGRRKELKQWKSDLGYCVVSLEKGKRGGDRESKFMNVHRAVAMAFIPNPNNLPQVNHKDENPSNNNVDNLEWCSAKYNMNYGDGAKTRHLKIDYSTEKRKDLARENGAKTTSKKVYQFTKKGELVKVYKSIHEAGRATGINSSHIGEVANRSKIRSTAGGFVWSFSKGGIL